MIQRKVPGLFITPQNLAELYTYLEFFMKYYDGFDQEAEVLMNGIREISEMTGIPRSTVQRMLRK